MKPKKVFKYKDLYGNIRGAKTYSPNQIRYSENTERHSDLKLLTQYEETHRVNLQVPDISSPGYPVDVQPMIYILFVFAVEYSSFYVFISFAFFVPSL